MAHPGLARLFVVMGSYLYIGDVPIPPPTPTPPSPAERPSPEPLPLPGGPGDNS